MPGRSPPPTDCARTKHQFRQRNEFAPDHATGLKLKLGMKSDPGWTKFQTRANVSRYLPGLAPHPSCAVRATLPKQSRDSSSLLFGQEIVCLTGASWLRQAKHHGVEMPVGTTAKTGERCPESGIWKVVGTPTTTAPIAKSNVMPPYANNAVTWRLTQLA